MVSFFVFRCNLFDFCNVKCLSFKARRWFQQTVKELLSFGTHIFILKWIPRGREKELAVRTDSFEIRRSTLAEYEDSQ